MNALKGSEYENHVLQHYFRKGFNGHVWINLSEEILRDLGIITDDWNQWRYSKRERILNKLPDDGIDLVIYKEENGVRDYTVIQAKCYENSTLTLHSIETFGMMLYIYGLKGKVVCPSVTKVHSRLLYHIRPSVKRPIEIERIDFQNPVVSTIQPHLRVKVIIRRPLYKHQLDTIEKIKDLKKCRVGLPCGSGKTRVFAEISSLHLTTIVVSPTIQLTDQNLEKMKGWVKYDTTLAFHSGIDSDIHKLENFINGSGKKIVSICRESFIEYFEEIFDLVNESFYIVFDEFHLIPYNQFKTIKQLNEKNCKVHYFSATPIIYDFEESNDNEKDFEDEFEDLNLDDDTNEEVMNQICGPLEVFMNIEESINRDLSTNYQLIIPEVIDSSPKDKYIDEISKEVDISIIESSVKYKSIFLLRGILEKGCKKCIVYCHSIDQVRQMKDSLCTMNDYFMIENLEVSIVHSQMKTEERKGTLESFLVRDVRKVKILINVDVVGVGFDCIDVDCIAFMHNRRSETRVIQNLSRGTRIDPLNPGKVCSVFLWCDEYDDLLDTFRVIGKYDRLFMKKLYVYNTNKSESMVCKDLVNEEVRKDFDVKLQEVDKRMYSWKERIDKVAEFYKKEGRYPKEKKDGKIGKVLSHLRTFVSIYFNICKYTKGLKVTKEDITYAENTLPTVDWRPQNLRNHSNIFKAARIFTEKKEKSCWLQGQKAGFMQNCLIRLGIARSSLNDRSKESLFLAIKEKFTSKGVLIENINSQNELEEIILTHFPSYEDKLEKFKLTNRQYAWLTKSFCGTCNTKIDDLKKLILDNIPNIDSIENLESLILAIEEVSGQKVNREKIDKHSNEFPQDGLVIEKCTNVNLLKKILISLGFKQRHDCKQKKVDTIRKEIVEICNNNNISANPLTLENYEYLTNKFSC